MKILDNALYPAELVDFLHLSIMFTKEKHDAETLRRVILIMGSVHPFQPPSTSSTDINYL